MFASRAEREKRGGIYAIRNLATQKEYVGSAVCISKRIKEHTRALRRGRHHSTKLQASWNKHGEQAFSFGVLAIVEDPAALIACEQEWLDALDTVEHGYNVAPTAGSCLGRKCAPETRQRISEAQLGKPRGPLSPEHRAAISVAHCGKTLSAEHREALSAAHSGKTLSAEHRAALAAALLGKTLPAEHRAAISAGSRGKPKSAEHCAAVSAAQRGRTFSAEHCAAISAAKRGKPWSAARAAARA